MTVYIYSILVKKTFFKIRCTKIKQIRQWKEYHTF